MSKVQIPLGTPDSSAQTLWLRPMQVAEGARIDEFGNAETLYGARYSAELAEDLENVLNQSLDRSGCFRVREWNGSPGEFDLIAEPVLTQLNFRPRPSPAAYAISAITLSGAAAMARWYELPALPYDYVLSWQLEFNVRRTHQQPGEGLRLLLDGGSPQTRTLSVSAANAGERLSARAEREFSEFANKIAQYAPDVPFQVPP